MTAPDYQSGEDINLDPWRVMGSPIQTYTPELTATTTNPTLGTGGVQLGWWTQANRIVAFWGRIRFGTSGTNPGSGFYRVSLPTAAGTPGVASATLAAGMVLGRGAIRDNNNVVLNSRHATMQLITKTGGTGSVGTAAWVLFDGAVSQANDSTPFVFSDEDALIFQGIYLID